MRTAPSRTGAAGADALRRRLAALKPEVEAAIHPVFAAAQRAILAEADRRRRQEPGPKDPVEREFGSLHRAARPVLRPALEAALPALLAELRRVLARAARAGGPDP